MFEPSDDALSVAYPRGFTRRYIGLGTQTIPNKSKTNARKRQPFTQILNAIVATLIFNLITTYKKC